MPHSRLAVTAFLALLCAGFSVQIVYEFPPLRGGEQDKPFRTQAEVNETGAKIIAAYAGKGLAADGILDVTKAPYLAKGDGKTDDTTALQRALRDARDARLVAWLPAGVYLVSDTLQCVQGAIDPRPPFKLPPEERLRANDFPCVIQGPSEGDRAIIRLRPGAAGFNDPARPKPLLLVWARSWTPPHQLAPNVSFNQAVVNLVLDVRGNPGAIALDMQGAQGTVVENVLIEAGGAFAGVRGLQGSGGSTSRLTVRGGKYGVYAVGLGPYAGLSGSQPAPLLTGIVLEGQAAAGLEYAGRGPLTVAGAHIRGAGIVCRGGNRPYNGALNLIDAVLEIEEGRTAIVSDRPVYLRNTYVRGAKAIVELAGAAPLKPESSLWTRIIEYAGAPNGPFPMWIDGKKQPAPLVRKAPAQPPNPSDLVARHQAPLLPDWNSSRVVNVRRPPYSAKGDGKSDDTAALQRAIDENSAVFLPKGRYKISRPLTLRAHSVMFGVGSVFTEIMAATDADAFSNPRSPSPIVDTVDDAAASTALAFLQLRPLSSGAYALRWRTGAQSVVRNVSFHRWPAESELAHPLVLIESHGGGRWYNLVAHSGVSGHVAYRNQAVRGTSQPLVIYMLNTEHARSEVMTEFEGVRNVTIFAVKGETHSIGKPETGTRPLIRFRNSSGFQVFGFGGILGVSQGWPPYIVEIENCRDFTLTNFAHQKDFSYFSDPSTWSVLRDYAPGRKIHAPGNEHFVLYRIGETN